MIYSIEGRIASKKDSYLVIIAGGIGYKIYAGKKMITGLDTPEIKLFTYQSVKEDSLDLYGFLEEKELNFFEMLISVSGVGPKSALSIMDVGSLQDLAAAIQEGRPDLLTKASGIGRKTAERIIVELKTKMNLVGSESVVQRMESDTDLIETLASLGYRKEDVRRVLQDLPAAASEFEVRLKLALKELAKNKK